jgi:hypothetical protein
MLRAQRRRETEGGWADMREELLAKVLELLEAAGWQQGGLGFSQTSATVRLVCAGWKAMHDALVTRLVLRWQTTNEVMRMLVRSFPAVVLLKVKWGRSVLTDEALRAVSSLPALTSLILFNCEKVTDVGVRVLSILPTLTTLNLHDCPNVTAAGMQTLRNTTTAPSLHITSQHGALHSAVLESERQQKRRWRLQVCCMSLKEWGAGRVVSRHLG